MPWLYPKGMVLSITWGDNWHSARERALEEGRRQDDFRWDGDAGDFDWDFVRLERGKIRDGNGRIVGTDPTECCVVLLRDVWVWDRGELAAAFNTYRRL